MESTILWCIDLVVAFVESCSNTSYLSRRVVPTRRKRKRTRNTKSIRNIRKPRKPRSERLTTVLETTLRRAPTNRMKRWNGAFEKRRSSPSRETIMVKKASERVEPVGRYRICRFLMPLRGSCLCPIQICPGRFSNCSLKEAGWNLVAVRTGCVGVQLETAPSY